MTPLLTRPTPAPPRSRADLFVAAVLGVIGVASLLPILAALRLPAYVETVTVTNPHPWHVEVDVGPPDGSRWIGLGHVPRESTSSYADVIDAGDEWTFRFTHGGIEHGRVTVRSSELERSKWNVTTPDALAERLRTAGELPSAPE
jgi:hypothetical protein